MGMTRLVRHVAYLGDSILRTSFCRNLFTQLHDGDATGDCTYDPGLFEYQFTSKTFHLSSRPWCADPRGHVRFSQNSSTTVPTSRYLPFSCCSTTPNPSRTSSPSSACGSVPVPRSFTNPTWKPTLRTCTMSLEADRAQHRIRLPTGLVSSMRRVILKHHGEWAIKAINSFQERHPDLRINEIDSFPIFDSRPDIASDGR